MLDQLVDVQLPDDLLGLGRAYLVRRPALEVGLAALVEDFQGLDLGVRKDRESLVRPFENVGAGVRRSLVRGGGLAHRSEA
ncbi:MAG: hypothetical protein ACT4PL_00010 [Phycisphaerales bacterium]